MGWMFTRFISSTWNKLEYDQRLMWDVNPEQAKKDQAALFFNLANQVDLYVQENNETKYQRKSNKGKTLRLVQKPTKDRKGSPKKLTGKRTKP